jgi:hypothetical protein
MAIEHVNASGPGGTAAMEESMPDEIVGSASPSVKRVGISALAVRAACDC